MLKLQQLIANTPSEVRIRSKLCAASLTKLETKKKFVFKFNYTEYVYTTRCTDGTKLATIRVYSKAVNHLSPVWVSCTCPYWKYYCEYAVTQPGSSSILYCNGKRPVIRNPPEIPYLCKHLFVAVNQMIAYPGKQASVVTYSTADLEKDILTLLHASKLTREQLEVNLTDVASMQDIKTYLGKLIRRGLIEKIGTEYQINENGLYRLTDILLKDDDTTDQ